MKERKENLEIRIDDAKITFRNFCWSRSKQFNPAGNRNFCVFLPDDVRKMEADGWNIKWLNEPQLSPSGHYYREA